MPAYCDQEILREGSLPVQADLHLWILEKGAHICCPGIRRLSCYFYIPVRQDQYVWDLQNSRPLFLIGNFAQ